MGLLLLTTTLIALTAAAVVVARAWSRGNHKLRNKVAAAAVAWAAIYLTLLVAISSRSQESLLARNQEKAFCGFYLDCHLRAAVTGVFVTKQIGEPPEVKTAGGVFYVVSVRVSSDAQQATLSLENPKAVVIDDAGREFTRALDAEDALEWSEHKSVPFEQPIAPASAYTKKIVFDLPVNAANPRLLLTEGNWAARAFEFFLIGDEDSLMHKKTVFRLEPETLLGRARRASQSEMKE